MAMIAPNGQKYLHHARSINTEINNVTSNIAKPKKAVVSSSPQNIPLPKWKKVMNGS
jgi:hypothetical protein